MATTATVKYSAKLCQTQYGERYNAVLIIDETEEEIKLWGDANSDVSFLERGQKVTVINTGDKWRIAHNSPITPAPPAPQGTIEDDKKRAIKLYVSEMAGLYGYCLTQAQAIAPAELPPDAVKDVATTLFITTQRKFNL